MTFFFVVYDENAAMLEEAAREQMLEVVDVDELTNWEWEITATRNPSSTRQARWRGEVRAERERVWR